MARYLPRCSAMLTVVFDARTLDPKDNSPAQHIVISPREASVSMNGYHEADTWTLEFDTRQLPFDPDSIASCNVIIYMWDDADGFVGDRMANDSFEMIRGICDEDEGVMVGEDNSIKLSGRDYTALIMAKTWDPKKTIKGGIALDLMVQQIADDAAPEGTSARFVVTWESSDGVPLVGSVHRKAKKEKGLQIKGEKNNWDVIYDLVLQHGYIVYIVGSEIRITDPATQTRQSLSSASTFVYGKHLDSLSVKRKFGRDKVSQIVVTAYDPDSDDYITVQYPDKTNVVVDGLAVTKDSQEFYPGPAGVTDKAALKRYAGIMFHYKGRGETSYEFKTHCLSLINETTGTVSADLLRFRTGQAVGIKFDPFNKEHIRSLSVAQRLEHIIGLGYSRGVAKFAAQNIDALVQYEQPYYLSLAKFDYSIDQGLEIEITANNFASALRELHFTDKVANPF